MFDLYGYLNFFNKITVQAYVDRLEMFWKYLPQYLNPHLAQTPCKYSDVYDYQSQWNGEFKLISYHTQEFQSLLRPLNMWL